MSQNFVSDQSFCAGLISEPPDLEMSAPLSESSDAEPGYDKPRKKRRLNPELWDYSRSPKGSEQLRDKHYHEIYYCKLCEAYRGSPNAQRFREHLARKHHVYVGKTSNSRQKISFASAIKDIFAKQAEKLEGRDTEQERQLQSAIQQSQLEEACVRLITVRNLPHSILDWPEFWSVILAVNYTSKSIIKLTRKSVPKLIEATFLHHFEQLKKKLGKALSWIHFSIDMWTSPSKTGYQAIVAHWADEETRQAECALISLREFKGGHGGEEQARVFLEVIDEYKLSNRIGFFTMDNASSNDKMLRYISERIADFHPVLRRVRCNGHIINLAVQSFLFSPKRSKRSQSQHEEDDAIELAITETRGLSEAEKQSKMTQEKLAEEWRKHGALGKLHNLNVWYRASTARYQEFISKVGRAIPLDNETRWNSWAIEVAVALSKRKEINSWQEDHHSELGEDRLEFKDWQELQQVDEFLQPFLSATKGTEGEESSLDDMLMSMDFLIEHFKLQKEKHKNNPQMTTRILASWFKFDKYYQLTDDSPIYAAAVLLNPALRRAYLDSAWSHQTAYIEPAVEQAREMWTQSFKPMVTTTTEEALAAIKDPFQRFRAKATGFVSIKDEFDDFINVSVSTFLFLRMLISSSKANPHPIGSQSPLEWWLEPSRRALYPNLQQMAVTVFTIPPMSAGPERVFSGTRHTIAPERVRLGAKMVEMTECVKSWVHIRPGRARAVLSGVFRNSQHADDALGVLQEDSHREEASEAEVSLEQSD